MGKSAFPRRLAEDEASAKLRNLRVIQVDEENNRLVVKGAVPGAPGGHVLIRRAVAARPRRKSDRASAEDPGSACI